MIFYVNILVNLILRNYFGDSRCLLIFSDFGLEYNGELPSVRIRKVEGTLIFQNYGCQGIVIHSSNPLLTFTQFEAQIKLNMERFNKRRILMVVTNQSKNFESFFFKSEELNFVSDLLVVVAKNLPDETFEFELKTHKYVGKSTNTPLLLDKWFSKNQTFLFGINLYPDKLTNQDGRPLRMATFRYEPYSVIGRSVQEHHGSELVAAIQFAIKHNMTPVLTVNEEYYWGEIYPNWTGRGLLGNLVQDKADIGFGALSTWEPCYRYLDLSMPSVRTGVTCLVPAPKASAHLLAPIFPFSSKLWLCTLSTLIVTINILSLILWWTKRCEGRNYVYYLAVATKVVTKPLLQEPLSHHEIPAEASGKLVICLILVLSFVLTNSYSSGLATMMTLPQHEKAIKTVQDFAESGLRWGATDKAWITSIQNARELDYVKVVNQFYAATSQELQQLSRGEKFAFGIERLPFENFAIGSYISKEVIGDFHAMQEDFYYAYCVMMLRKNSVLLPSLDMFLLRVTETGLIFKWQKRAVNLFMDTEVQKVIKYRKHHKLRQQLVKLNWNHIEGALVILALGYAISLIVFVVELVKNSRKQ